jgi:NADPH:quinone reductase-like Zn-dependent oxidoreductase
VDLVYDAVGGETLDSSVQALKQGGTLITIAGPPDQEKAAKKNIQVASISAQVNSELLHTFAQLVAEEKIKVVIAKVFPLNQALQAHELSQSGHGRGRIILHIAD